jgi:hypothetical protein
MANRKKLFGKNQVAKAIIKMGSSREIETNNMDLSYLIIRTRFIKMIFKTTSFMESYMIIQFRWSLMTSNFIESRKGHANLDKALYKSKICYV